MAEYIERESFKKHIKDLPTWWADGGGVYGQAMKYPEGMFDCNDVIASIENAPTADVVEVVHGRWIKKQFADDITGLYTFAYRCSECHTTWETNSNYCPYCGADMRAERKCEDG